jgi:hypothetical protein
MADSSQQSFASHAKWTPIFHFVLAPMVVVLVIWSAYRAMITRSVDTHVTLLAAFSLVVVTAVIRISPVKLQDRIIRLEETVRFMRLLPPDLQARMNEFSVDQMVALRFASDAELPTLARRVLDEKLMTRKDIKMQIKTWRADDFRI